MKQFIILTTFNSKMRANINYIVSYSGSDGGSKVLIAGVNDILYVEESPEHIDALIENAL
jgi:hypothetical protein